VKHAQLRAIAHNLADSIAGGLSFVLGIYELDVFGEARISPGGAIAIDFLAGKVTEGQASASLSRAAALAAETLPDFCRKHGASTADFAELSVRFFSDSVGHRAEVAVTDDTGIRSVTEYSGIPLKRVRVLDPLGRLRPAPTRV
jgi:hypothetical protein